MICGRGDIAKVITDREGFLFYCNGVSNRLPLAEPLLNAEQGEVRKLIREMPKSDMFVYISTLSVYYSNSVYTWHKKRMEKIIQASARHYAIIRIGNITWGDNPNTLINFLTNHPEVQRQNVFRYLCDKEELNHWLSMIPRTGQHIMNITGRRINVKDL